MLCSKCNNQIDDNSKFCEYCGNETETPITIQDDIPIPASTPQNAIPDEIFEAVNNIPSDTISPNISDLSIVKKNRYCKNCGTSVDNITVFCPSCGGNNFKKMSSFISAIPIAILAFFLVLSILFNIFQGSKISQYDDQYLYSEQKIYTLEAEINDLSQQISDLESDQAELRSTNSQMEEQIVELEEEMLSYEELSDFIDRHVVFIEDDNSNLYHKFNCSNFKRKSFWAYNIDNAISRDYTPCPQCH